MNIETVMQMASAEVLKLFEKIGLSKELFNKIEISPSTDPDKILLTVEISASALEEVFFLRGGKICAILQSFAKDLPKDIQGVKVEWLFSPYQEKTKKTADAFDTGLLGQAIDNMGNWAVEHKVPELVTGFMVAKHIWEQMRERDWQEASERAGMPVVRI